MNKTSDIEYAITAALKAGPRTLDDMEARLPDPLRREDRRWISVALSNLEDDGRVRFKSCNAGHDHDGACVVEGTR